MRACEVVSPSSPFVFAATGVLVLLFPLGGNPPLCAGQIVFRLMFLALRHGFCAGWFVGDPSDLLCRFFLCKQLFLRFPEYAFHGSKELDPTLVLFQRDKRTFWVTRFNRKLFVMRFDQLRQHRVGLLNGVDAPEAQLDNPTVL